MNDKRQAVLT